MPMYDTMIFIGEVVGFYILLMGLLVLGRWLWPTVYIRTGTLDEVMKCPHCGASHDADV